MTMSAKVLLRRGEDAKNNLLCRNERYGESRLAPLEAAREDGDLVDAMARQLFQNMPPEQWETGEADAKWSYNRAAAFVNYRRELLGA